MPDDRQGGRGGPRDKWDGDGAAGERGPRLALAALAALGPGPPGQSLGSTISNDGTFDEAPSRCAGSLGGCSPGDVRLVSVSRPPGHRQRRRETSPITFSSTNTTTGLAQFNATGISAGCGPRLRRVQFGSTDFAGSVVSGRLSCSEGSRSKLGWVEGAVNECQL